MTILFGDLLTFRQLAASCSLTGIQPQIALATWASSRWHLKKTFTSQGKGEIINAIVICT